MEIIGNIKDKKFLENERFVSFDIKSFYSNVTKTGTLIALREWLDEQKLNPIEHDALYKLTEVCIDQSYYQFRGE